MEVITHENYKGKAERLRTPKGSMLAVAALSIFLTPDTFANVIGTTTQNFNPTSNGVSHITVESAKTLKGGDLTLGLFFNHAQNTLPYYAEDHENTGHRDSLVGGSLGVGYGISEKLELGMAIPYLIDQSINSNEVDRGQFDKRGYQDLHVGLKYNLVDTSLWGLSFSASTNINQTKNDPALGSDSSNTYNGQIISSIYLGKFTVSGNLGYRHYTSGDEKTFENTPLESASNKVIASSAVSYDLERNFSSVIFEMFGSFPNRGKETGYDRSATSSEWNVAYKRFLQRDLALSVGGGKELSHGEYTPDMRLFAGINWNLSTKSKPVPRTIIAEKKPEIITEQDTVLNERTIVINDILFKLNSATLIEKNADKTLVKVAEEISRGEFNSLIISGHTCSLGSDSYNNDLSYRRAMSIKKYLVKKHKIEAIKIEIRGHGESQPVASNDTEANRQLNRRVEFTFVKNNSMSYSWE